MSVPFLSVIIPVYNEVESLEALYQRLFAVLDALNKTFEVIFVNDGSRDDSNEMLKHFHNQRPQQIRVIEFNRNYGQQLAIMAGLEHSRGTVMVTMDADLQNYPEDIAKFLDKIAEGHDVVGGYRENRQDKMWRLAFSRLHNWLRLKFTKIQMIDEGCMFRAYTRGIVSLMVKCQENSTYIPALASNFASHPTDIPVRHTSRQQGKSKYNFYKLVQCNFDFFANFSRAPLEFFTITGFIVAVLSSFLFAYTIVDQVIHGTKNGNAPVFFSILYFLIGVLLMGIGVLGEYIGRIQEQVRKRPRFIIRHIFQQKDKDILEQAGEKNEFA